MAACVCGSMPESSASRARAIAAATRSWSLDLDLRGFFLLLNFPEKMPPERLYTKYRMMRATKTTLTLISVRVQP